MKLREFLVGTALMSISFVTAKASVPVPNDEGWFDFGNSCNIASEESMSVPLVPNRCRSRPTTKCFARPITTP